MWNWPPLVSQYAGWLVLTSVAYHLSLLQHSSTERLLQDWSLHYQMFALLPVTVYNTSYDTIPEHFTFNIHFLHLSTAPSEGISRDWRLASSDFCNIKQTLFTPIILKRSVCLPKNVTVHVTGSYLSSQRDMTHKTAQISLTYFTGTITKHLFTSLQRILHDHIFYMIKIS